MSLRLARTSTTRLDIGDDGDFIDVKQDITRRAFNELISSIPRGAVGGEDNDTIDFAVASDFSQGLFGAFAVAWSVVAEDGAAVPCNIDNYNELSRDSAQLIDTAISEHFSALTPDAKETTKSKNASK